MANNLSKEILLALRDSDPAILSLLKERYARIQKELVFAIPEEVPLLQGQGREVDYLIGLIEGADQKLKEIHRQESKKS